MNRRKKRIFWIAYGSLLNLGGYCLRVMNVRANTGQLTDYEHYLINFANFRSQRFIDRFNSSYGKTFTKIYSFRLLPNRNIALYVLNTLGAMVALFCLYVIYRPIFLYCHGLRASAIALLNPFLNRGRIFLDLHGAHVEELVDMGIYSKGSIYYDFDRLIESVCVRRASKIIAVSHQMKLYLLNNFHRKENVYVIPCCFDKSFFKFNQEDRNIIRHELDLEENVVLVYSGSFAVWQNLPKILLLFQRLIAFDVCFKLIILSMDDKQKILDLLESFELPTGCILFCSASQNQVSKYLSASDIGVLFRENNLLNQVASPTKFGEYLACGLPVIISGSVGDFTEITRNEKLGMVLDDDYDASVVYDRIVALVDESVKKRCVEYARKALAWDSARQIYNEVFSWSDETVTPQGSDSQGNRDAH